MIDSILPGSKPVYSGSFPGISLSSTVLKAKYDNGHWAATCFRIEFSNRRKDSCLKDE